MLTLYPTTFEYGTNGVVVVVINVEFETPSTINNSLLANKVLPIVKSEVKLVPTPKTVFAVSLNVLLTNNDIGDALYVDTGKLEYAEIPDDIVPEIRA